MMVEFEGEKIRPSELVAKLEAKRARTCQDCGLEDPSLIVGSCLGCISEKKGYERCRADVVAGLRSTDMRWIPDMANMIESGGSDGVATKAAT